MPVISKRPAGNGVEMENALDDPSLELPASGGWPALFKPVRDSDLVKVNDCKDDIDTLLVFAGLYSAVLTAFIIESYQSLQQDKQDIIIDLMQRQLMKDYAINSGFLNSTISMPPPPPPFEPPLWAIRVNVLWFSSLILSLGAASFGMLVKQWLREYLALEYVSARDRLCAREYRNPALATWGVFEVAAALPLLLQLSLCFFFVGLCFFTSAVHSSIGHTTIPIVAAWAFLLLLTIVAPLFSPRCPYKMTFLKRAMRIGRRFVAPYARPFVHSCLQRASSVTKTAMRVVTHHNHGVTHAKDSGKPDWNQALLEEESVVRSNRADVDILLSIDANREDDALLPNMLMALDQQKDAPNLTEFVIRILNDRYGFSLPLRQLTSIPDLRSLPRYLWLCLTGALARALGTLIQEGVLPHILPHWALDAFILLLSYSNFELPLEGIRMVQIFFGAEQNHNFLAGALGKRLQQAGPPEQFRLPPQLVRSLILGGRVPCLNCFLGLYSICLYQEPRHGTDDILSFFALHRTDLSFWGNLSSTYALSDLLQCSTDLLSWVLTLPSGNNPPSSSLLRATVELCRGIRRHDSLITLCRFWWLNWFEVPSFMAAFGAVHPAPRVLASDDKGSEDILAEVLRASSAEERKTMISHCRNWYQAYATGAYVDFSKWWSIDIVRHCYVLLHTHHQLKMSTSIDKLPGPKDSIHAASMDRSDWLGLWGGCAEALMVYHETQGWTRHVPGDGPRTSPGEALQQDRIMAAQCLDLISWNTAQPAGDSPQEGDGQESICPGALSDALRLFIDTDAAPPSAAAALQSPHATASDSAPDGGSATAEPGSGMPPDSYSGPGGSVIGDAEGVDRQSDGKEEKEGEGGGGRGREGEGEGGGGREGEGEVGRQEKDEQEVQVP